MEELIAKPGKSKHRQNSQDGLAEIWAQKYGHTMTRNLRYAWSGSEKSKPNLFIKYVHKK